MSRAAHAAAARTAAAADHDDLCPISVGPESLPCACYLISRVRENEQERHSQALSDVESRVRRELAEEIAQAIEREGGDYCRETCTCVVMALAIERAMLEGVMGR